MGWGWGGEGEGLFCFVFLVLDEFYSLNIGLAQYVYKHQVI